MSDFNRNLKPKYSEGNRAVKPTTETSAFRARRNKIKDDPQDINSFRKLLLEIDSNASVYLQLRLSKSRSREDYRLLKTDSDASVYSRLRLSKSRSREDYRLLKTDSDASVYSRLRLSKSKSRGMV